MTLEEFGNSIKNKYPQYKDIDSNELGQRMLEKYPQYKDRVSIEQSSEDKLRKLFGMAIGKEKLPFDFMKTDLNAENKGMLAGSIGASLLGLGPLGTIASAGLGAGLGKATETQQPKELLKAGGIGALSELGGMSIAKGVVKVGKPIIEDFLPKAVQFLTGKNYNLVKARILEAFDPFSGKLSHPEALQEVAIDLQNGIEKSRKLIGKQIEELDSTIEQKMINTNKSVDIKDLQDRAFELLTDKNKKPMPIRKAVDDTLTVGDQTLGETITTFSPLLAIRRSLQSLQRGSLADPITGNYLRPSTFEQKQLGELIKDVNNKLYGLAEDIVDTSAMKDLNLRYSNLLSSKDQLTKKLGTSISSMTKSLERIIKKEGSDYTDLKSIFSSSKEIPQILQKARSAIISQEISPFFRYGVQTGLYGAPLAGLLLGGPETSQKAGGLGALAALVTSPRLATSGARYLAQNVGSLTPLFKSGSSLAIQNYLTGKTK